MPLPSWALWLALTGAVIAASLVHYRRRETPGRGRAVLALLRALALALLLLLVFDPELPARGGVTTRGTQVLLDGSLSMTLPAAGGGTRWEEAVAAARSRAGNRPVIVFGERPRPVPVDSLPQLQPGDGRSLLLPALQAAAEAGVRRVVVITDGGLEDADAVARWAPRLGLDVDAVIVGGDVANRTLAEVTAPAWLESGQPARIEFGVAGTQGTDSVAVVARRDGRVVGRTVVPSAGAGRLATGSLEVRLEPPAGGGRVRLDVGLETADAVADDDTRTVYIHVSDEPAGIALVSLRPDWEPRFLAPVLEQALGLPLHAWIRSATGQYVRLAGGLQAGAQQTEAEVRRAVDGAELVVLHGAGPDAPQWVVDALTTARRLLVFPADAEPRVPLPVAVGPELTADFYPAPNVPASPVAPLLADLELTGLTPLSGLRTADLPATAWTPLAATRGRQGAALPVLAAGEQGGRRWAVALGSGYWNWAFRGGQERQVYERLWGAVGGWLVRERGTATLPAVRPATPSRPRAEAVPWLTSGLAADSVRITLTDEAGAAVQDTVITVAGADTIWAGAPPPGHYSYSAEVFGEAAQTAAGPLTVERFSPEFARPAAALGELRAAGALIRSDDARGRGTPLHATAWPYVLLLGLLAAEWILRRRWGLR